MPFARFAIIVLALVLGGYAALLGLGRSPVYCTHSRSFFDTAPCFQAETRGQDADVLLVGDSALLYGIDPARVAAAGGGSTYNLGMVGPSFGFDPAGLIDRYLANNRRPKAIILYFAPGELIANDRIADPQWAPLGLYLLRHGSAAEFAHFVRIRPSALVELPPVILSGLVRSGSPIAGTHAQMIAAHGFIDYAQSGTAPLPAGCRRGQFRPVLSEAIDNRASVAALRERYRGQGIPLFVYVAPVARCDDQLATALAAAAGVADNVPEELPDPLFANDVAVAKHVHASADGVPVMSGQLARFIATRVRPAA